MKPLIIGLTGGIGCGKSTICKAFSQLAIPIIDTDQIARDVVAPGQPALETLVQHFSSTILNKDNSLNRAHLKTLLFNDPQNKKFIETVLHPLILAQLNQQLTAITAPYVVVEIPLLIEANWQSVVDQILVIDIPETLQLERLMQREDATQSEVQAMIDNQISRTERNRYATQLVDNSATPSALSRQVSELHQHYLKLAENSHP
ncbi:MAG: dephospho-CoA kinase [Chromatiales bacterium]|nr:dephospho-CoA kinase [Chromatiales bacterium]